jgi:murein L,D-transpeptidase YafK
MHKLLPILFVLFLTSCTAGPAVDEVLVKKSENKMYLMKRGKVLKSYYISLGGNPTGHKVREGDLRTPEGRYRLIHKNDNSKFYRSITISYPNDRDKLMARKRGFNPGGDIVIHGFPNGLGNVTGAFEPQNWTEGCIAVRNHEMDEMFTLIALDTPIEIKP